MPSLKRVPRLGLDDRPRVPSAQTTSVEDDTKRKRTHDDILLNSSTLAQTKRTKKGDDADDRDDRQCIEPAVTDGSIEEGKAGFSPSEVTRDARDDTSCALLVTHESGGALKEHTTHCKKVLVELDSQRNHDASRQGRNVTDETIDADDDCVSLEDEPVYPHDLKSATHDILSHFIAAPFHHRTMKALYSRINNEECTVLMPSFKLPITSQKRYIQLVTLRMNQQRSIQSACTNMRQTDSGVYQVSTKPSPSQNTRMIANSLTDHAMPPQSLINHQQIQQPRHTTHVVPPQQSFWNLINSAQTYINQPTSKPTVMHSPYYAQHNMMQMNSQPHPNMTYVASPNGAPNGFPQATSFPYQYFPGNSYLNNFQHFRMMQLSQAMRNTTTSIPSSAPPVPAQTVASKPITLTESNTQSTTKSPVAFGFQLNADDNGKSLQQAKSADAELAQNGMKPIQAKDRTPTSSIPKAGMTPRTSPSLKPNSSLRITPKIVPTKIPTNDLPKGWTTKTFLRQSGNSAGSTDTYFYSPLNQIKFRSKKAVRIFSDILLEGEVDGDERKAFKLFKQRGHKV